MALVGHGLIGLAMGGCVPSGARNHRLPYVWLGIMVLLAYAVDLAEWFAVVFEPDLADRRFVNHSPFLVACVAVGVCAVLGAYCRLRRVWPYAVIGGVVFSHLLLDLEGVRIAVAEWYSGQTFEDGGVSYAAVLPAEFCVYGAPLVWTLLIRASFVRGCSRRARAASRALVALSVLSALTRVVAIWAPVYALSVLHALIVLRRHVNIRQLWNIVPLLPLFVAGFTTWVALHRFEQGVLLAQRGLDEKAIHAYQAALNIPAHLERHNVYMRMGMSCAKVGDLATAENAYRRAIALSVRPGWPQAVLADFYVRHEGTPFYRPERAVRLYTRLLETDGTPDQIQAYARARLRGLRERSVAPPTRSVPEGALGTGGG